MAKAFMRLVRAPGRKSQLANLNSIAQQEIKARMNDKIKPALVASFEKIVEDWTSDVGFQARLVVKTDSIAVYVYPTGEDKLIWTYVDKGTRPHDIPKDEMPPGKFLWFEWGGPGSYVPKTMAKPARTVVGGGRVQGGHLVRMKKVHHPGTEGRDFTGQIARDIEPFFQAEIDSAFRQAARKANGG